MRKTFFLLLSVVLFTLSSCDSPEGIIEDFQSDERYSKLSISQDFPFTEKIDELEGATYIATITARYGNIILGRLPNESVWIYKKDSRYVLVEASWDLSKNQSIAYTLSYPSMWNLRATLISRVEDLIKPKKVDY